VAIAPNASPEHLHGGDTWEELRKNAIEATAAFFSIGRSLSESACTFSATEILSVA